MLLVILKVRFAKEFGKKHSVVKRSAGRRVRVESLVGNATGRKLLSGRWPELEGASGRGGHAEKQMLF